MYLSIYPVVLQGLAVSIGLGFAWLLTFIPIAIFALKLWHQRLEPATKILFYRLISIGCLVMIFPHLLFTLMVSFGDNPFPEAVVDRSHPIGTNQIREKIYPTGINWRDQQYVHIYSLEQGNNSIELERFTNEERHSGISKTKPKIVGEWLAIFSAAQTFLWKSGSKPVEFYPHQIEGWHDYAARYLHHDINYHAKDFSIEGNRWVLEYECENIPCPQMKDNRTPPLKIRFFSDDFGKTFQIMQDANIISNLSR